MHKIAILLCFSLLLIGPANSYGQRANRDGAPRNRAGRSLSPKQIYDRIKPSLALIITKDSDDRLLAQGSGFFIGKDLVATNLHVFKFASSATVRVLNEETSYQVEHVTKIDLVYDLCVVQIRGSSAPPLSLANAPVSIGDEVFVAGNPRGLEGSFSRGIVSGVRSEIDMIQIDAPISAGSSGGPVVNNRGEVIGLVASSLPSGQQLNFAIPIKYLGTFGINRETRVADVGALALSDKEYDKLTGPVQSVNETQSMLEYNSRTDQYEPNNQSPWQTKTYDIHGNLIEIEFHCTDDSVCPMKTTYRYNNLGVIVQVVHSQGPDKSEEIVTLEEGIVRLINRREFGKRSHDLVIGGKRFRNLNSSSLLYDSRGNVTESTDFFYSTGKMIKETPGEEQFKVLTTYDDEGRPIEGKEYVKGELTFSIKYRYQNDRFGNWIEQYGESLSSKYAELGYSPSRKESRKITYYQN